MSSDVYERLAETLDALPNGFPRTESGIELKILKKIYTEEEAEITCNLKLLPESAEQIADRLGRDPAAMAETLERMRERGEIGSFGPPDQRSYLLQGFIIGVYEDQCIRPPANMETWMTERSEDTGKPLDRFI
jgi:hypothetical protein